jgi:hypothetical protein
VTPDEETEGHLGSVFDELVELIGEAKQAAWTATSTSRRLQFDDLRGFLAEQVVLIDDAELRLGARPAWITSPTAHPSRNLAAEAGGSPKRLVDVLAQDLRIVIDDIRRWAGAVDEEWCQLLRGLADGLEQRVDAL